MPSSPATSDASLVLISGEDDHAVRHRAKELFQAWCGSAGGFDHEVIDARVSNTGDALSKLARLRDALQTLPLFGSSKVVWFQDCNFLGEDRTANSAAVNEALQSLAEDLKKFDWTGVRLLITSGKVDKRKTFYKAVEKRGRAEYFGGWKIDDRHWPAEAAAAVKRQLQSTKKRIGADALESLIAMVGPNPGMLASEVEKLVLFIGERELIEVADVDAVVVQNKQSRAFAVGDALGERNLPKLLRALDEEFWSMRTDSQKSEIGLLYGLIAKVRVLILIQEMMLEGWIRPESDYSRFQAQLERIPRDQLPADPKYNPLSLNPYVLFKALQQAGRYSRKELTAAMTALLDCNRRLVSSAVDESLALQQTLVGILATS